MNIAIRGFVGRQVQFEDRISIDPDKLDELLPGLAEKHAAALATHALHMIEIEFLDEADRSQRYFRFGTDPSGMVLPIQVDLSPEKPD